MVHIFTAALILVSGTAPAWATPVNGAFRTMSGVRVLHIWGTHREMGYAHGYLLGAQIVDLFDRIFVPLVGGEEYMQANREKFLERFQVPAWHTEEVEGMIEGIAASGVSLYVDALGRDLDATDLATMDALSDIRTLYECASFAAWNDATTTDTVLQGESALARNLDWWAPAGEPYTLAANTLVIGREPDEARATLMVGFTGLSGCYSCMNEAGVATTRMMSNHGTMPWQMDFSRLFTPLNIVMRDALEAEDVDGDEASTVDDVVAALGAAARSSAYNIMVVGRAADGREPAVVEINNKEMAVRVATDEPSLPTTVLGATNHMRKLYAPIPDSRYLGMKADVLGWGGVLTLERMWIVLQTMYDEWMTGATTQSMIFVPSNRSVAISYTDETALAPFKPPTWLAWEDVFDPDDVGFETADDSAD
ncbi:MAG: hypothetical protein KJ042_01960, partial [Deltaproteobacteria bacterium]|nr:hypothetical protein [Deltaproteobacteria bacterium]